MRTLGGEFQHTLSECLAVALEVIPRENCSHVGTNIALLDDVHRCGACFDSQQGSAGQGAREKKKYFVLLCLPPRNVSFPSIMIIGA